MTTIITAGDIDAGAKTSGVVEAELIKANQVPILTLDLGKNNLGTLKPNYTTQVMLIANTSNWRKVAKDLIGDEPVTYEEKSKKDTLRKRPIINISSHDKEALNRVLTKAAEVE